ncbi:hypothetical protein ACFQ09_18730 [Massilia norwichensis]|jgi:hypothetical protein|uniref:Beta/gamma crystallin 'Greek key' domain-containing protein n=1 Tax=Massilia norwichensis TaxID=1442366 RepID=A0ABT2A864_9BURK|nr:hypothetical protein [Massilia norwichensis]MCS0590357.1 hypothetical protein [Massilia norwichensis]
MRQRFVQKLIVAGLAFSLMTPTFSKNANDSNSVRTASTTENVGLKVGEPFTKARARIVKLGWKPVRVHRNDGYEFSGTEKILAERGFVEVDSCSMDAGVLCIFHYRKASECLRVDTKGEQIRYMSVTEWTNACPEQQ